MEPKEINIVPDDMQSELERARKEGKLKTTENKYVFDNSAFKSKEVEPEPWQVNEDGMYAQLPKERRGR